ncbi:hypothetical protein ACLIA0_07610 [Bacillaceae bacterium W0354]
MNQVAWLYIAVILAGFALISLTARAASFIAPISSVLVGIGAITVIIFALAIIYLGLRELLSNHLK